MALHTCKSCGTGVAQDAKRCPRCGADNPAVLRREEQPWGLSPKITYTSIYVEPSHSEAEPANLVGSSSLTIVYKSGKVEQYGGFAFMKAEFSQDSDGLWGLLIYQGAPGNNKRIEWELAAIALSESGTTAESQFKRWLDGEVKQIFAGGQTIWPIQP